VVTIAKKESKAMSFQPAPLQRTVSGVLPPPLSPKKKSKKKRKKSGKKEHEDGLTTTLVLPDAKQQQQQPLARPTKMIRTVLNGWVEITPESLDNLPGETWVRYTVPKYQAEGFKVVTAILDGAPSVPGERTVKSTPPSKAFAEKLAKSGKTFDIMTWLLRGNKENLRVYIHSNTRKRLGL
jgi:hypothetical protein